MSALIGQAMILAAGHGQRMRELTRTTPKPLLRVGGKPLIEHHVLKLARAGIRRIVINHGRHGAAIEQTLGDGHRHGAEIAYSAEGDSPLETAGGVARALACGYLAEAPFLLVNADVYSDADFSRLRLPEQALAHLLLVDNPPHHAAGDFGLHAGWVCKDTETPWTYSGIGIYRSAVFATLPPGPRPLRPVLDGLIAAGKLSGARLAGLWLDVGTPARLAEADAAARQR